MLMGNFLKQCWDNDALGY